MQTSNDTNRDRRKLRIALWTLAALLAVAALVWGTVLASEKGIVGRGFMQAVIAIASIGTVVILVTASIRLLKRGGTVALLLAALMPIVPTNEAMAWTMRGYKVQTKTVEVLIPIGKDGKPDLTKLPPGIPDEVRKEIAERLVGMKYGELLVVGDTTGAQHADSETVQAAMKTAVASHSGSTLDGGEVTANMLLPEAGALFIVLLIIIVVVVGIILWGIYKLAKLLDRPRNGLVAGDGFTGLDSGMQPLFEPGAAFNQLTPEESKFPGLQLRNVEDPRQSKYQLQRSEDLVVWHEGVTLDLSDFRLESTPGGSNYVATLTATTNGVQMQSFALSTPYTPGTNLTFEASEPLRLEIPGPKPQQQFFRIVPIP